MNSDYQVTWQPDAEGIYWVADKELKLSYYKQSPSFTMHPYSGPYHHILVTQGAQGGVKERGV